jgi:phosphoenolpyruvate carboxykinase (GTP)
MLELKKGADILAEIGDIQTLEQAQALFAAKCDSDSLSKLSAIANQEALIKIANAIAMTDPDTVFVNSGTPEDIQAVREMSLTKGEESTLAMPGHTIHFDLAQEQARIVDRTFYIVNPDEDTSVLAKSILRAQALDYVRTNMVGIARGKTLFIGFFSRGPIGAPAAIPALEITTSTYVMHSANILYRNVYAQFGAEAERVGLFFTNVHSEGLNRPKDLPNARVYMDRSWQTTYSMFCTYAGNTLLLKKGNHRFAVDLATYYRKEDQLAEHMFVTGMTGPDGRKTYFAAMVGSEFIGDDLAQLWIADDGTLRAINPEFGIFGIVRDVNRETDPFLMKCLREEGTEVIWSNVLIDADRVPHWEGNGEKHPDRGTNFQGEWWEGKTDDSGAPIPISNPNARCTLRNTSIGNYNDAAAESPEGVHVQVITYSGRDSDTMPPVWVAKNPDHGVVIGASILSAATATELGVTGVRRQPWANEPFIPGPLADYMDAQFTFFNSDKLQDKPIIAGLNYFLAHCSRGGEGTDLLGEKRDVRVWLGWLERFAHKDVGAIETPIGYMPRYEDLKALFDSIGKEYPKALYERQFAFYVDNILGRIDLQQEAYHKEEGVPAQLFEVYEEQRAGLGALKAKYGSVVSVDQLIEAAG